MHAMFNGMILGVCGRIGATEKENLKYKYWFPESLVVVFDVIVPHALQGPTVSVSTTWKK